MFVYMTIKLLIKHLHVQLIFFSHISDQFKKHLAFLQYPGL